MFSYICIHNYVFKKCPKNKAMTYLVRDKAVALFFYNNWYHNYFKCICIHNYVISFLKIGYKENINLNIINLKKVYNQIYI